MGGWVTAPPQTALDSVRKDSTGSDGSGTLELEQK